MKRLTPTLALAAAVLALMVAVSGTAYSVAKVAGDSLLKKHSLSGNKLKADTVTGKQVKESSLGTVPSAASAAHAAVADRASAPALHGYAYGPSWGPEATLARAE